MTRRMHRIARVSRAAFMDCSVTVCKRVRRYVRKPRRVPWEARWCLAIACLMCLPFGEDRMREREDPHTHADFYEVPVLFPKGEE